MSDEGPRPKKGETVHVQGAINWKKLKGESLFFHLYLWVAMGYHRFP